MVDFLWSQEGHSTFSFSQNNTLNESQNFVINSARYFFRDALYVGLTTPKVPASGHGAKAELCTSAAVESPFQESCVTCVSAQIICQTFAAEASNTTTG